MTVALIERAGFEVDAIDVFCGYGGSSQGIHRAGATVRVAANHSELALDCHARNFPDTEHWQADLVDAADPQVLDRRGRKVTGRYLDPSDLPRARFAWFSPACTHHSQANAKKVYERGLQLAMFEDEEWDDQQFVNSERSRVTMSCVLRYVAHSRPEIVAVENVVEVTKWGPGRDGSSFRWWLGELDSLGYETELCFLNSMFFPPCPQSRDRVYIVAWRRGNRAPDLDYRPTAYCMSDVCGGKVVEARQSWKRRTKAWPTARWGKYGGQYDYRCPDCRSVVHPASWMALSAIDWSDLGPTLEERIATGRRPAPATWERLRRAVEKYRNAPPVVLPGASFGGGQVPVAHAEAVQAANSGSPTRYAGNRARHLGEQLPTSTGGNGLGVVVEATASLAVPGPEAQSIVALVVPNRTNGTASPSAGQIPPVMTSATVGVVVAAAGNTSERPGQTRCRPVVDPLFTQSSTAEFAVGTLPVLRGDHLQDGSVAEQLSTVSAAGQHHALVTALFSKINGGPGDTAWHGMGDPLNAITARDTTGLVVVPWVEHWQSDPVHVTEQLATITARLRHTLASIAPSAEPITDEQMMSLRFRMLQPDPELRRAMAFGDDYILLGNKGQMTAGLGNAVTPPVAEWITERCLATLGGDA